MDFKKMSLSDLRAELDRFVEQLARQQEQGQRITENQKKSCMLYRKNTNTDKILNTYKRGKI